MATLVLGASGATGKHLVNQLLLKNQRVKAIVRSPENLPEAWKNNKNITIIKGNIAELSQQTFSAYLSDCDAAASCLGHNGIYGKPKKIVYDAVRLLCSAVNDLPNKKPFKLVLMNTSGYHNKTVDKSKTFAEKLILGLVRLLVPPHSDNENAADFLKYQIGKNNPSMEWIVVRPDNLINNDLVTEYQVFPSPTRSPIFNPGKSSRINVGHFMASLIADKNLWEKWKGQMPLIYNVAS